MENALITITLRFCQKEKEQALYGLESVVSVKQNLVHLDSNMQQQNGWHKLTICLHHGPCKDRGGGVSPEQFRGDVRPAATRNPLAL